MQAESLLSPYRVLDLTDEKGLLCGKILADLGAEVIKVERPGGDAARNIGPFYHDMPDPEKSLFWFAWNTGKKSITLNLESRPDRQLFKKLVATADIVLESFPPGYLKELGLDFPSLSRISPGIIMTSISPFGQTGPFRDFKGPDIVCTAMGGVMYLTGEPADTPIQLSVPQAFLHAGAEAAVGSLFALWHRQNTGEGQQVDVSIQEAVTWECFHNQSFWDLNRRNIRREGIRRQFGPSLMRVLFPCRDGHVAIYIIGGNLGGKGQLAFVKWMDSEGMSNDFLRDFDWDSFDAATFSHELALKLEEPFGRFYLTKSKQELFHEAVKRKFLLAPVNSTRDLLEMEQLKARGYWTGIEHAELGEVIPYPGAPYHSSAPNYAIRGRAPLIGEHNQEILQPKLNLPPLKQPQPPNPAVPEVKQKRVFEGIKFLDFSWVVVGPSATRYFADHGAEVVRVESTANTDVLRTSHPFRDEIPGIDRSGYFANYNCNKYGVTINLRDPKGVALVKRLVKWADVVVESFTPRVMKGFGLDYGELKKIKPDIIMASSCQMGQYGPLSHFRGFGVQAASLAGFWSITGYPGGPPTGLYGAYGDMIAHRYLIISILMALEHRRRTGAGQYIDHSQTESGIHFLTPALLDYVVNGRVWKPDGNRNPLAAPHNAYRCLGEDSWCVIAVFSDEEWRAFVRTIGQPDWTRDRKFADVSGRKENETELDRLVTQWTVNHSAEEVMYHLQRAGVAAGVVEKAQDLHRDPQLKHRQHFWTLEHPVIGRHTYDAPGFRLSRTPAEPRRPSPCLGQHNELVCRDILGLSDEEISRLFAEGILE